MQCDATCFGSAKTTRWYCTKSSLAGHCAKIHFVIVRSLVGACVRDTVVLIVLHRCPHPHDRVVAFVLLECYTVNCVTMLCNVT